MRQIAEYPLLFRDFLHHDRWRWYALGSITAGRQSRWTLSLIECTFFEKGDAFAGNDSIFLDIRFSTFSGGIATGSFTMQTSGLGGAVTFTDSHFSNIPVTFATQ